MVLWGVSLKSCHPNTWSRTVHPWSISQSEPSFSRELLGNSPGNRVHKIHWSNHHVPYQHCNFRGPNPGWIDCKNSLTWKIVTPISDFGIVTPNSITISSDVLARHPVTMFSSRRKGGTPFTCAQGPSGKFHAANPGLGEFMWTQIHKSHQKSHIDALSASHLNLQKNQQLAGSSKRSTTQV